MAASFLRLGVCETRRMLLLEKLGTLAAFTTKAPRPQKKKIKGAGPHGVSVQATDMTTRERANLLSRKTLLNFPRKTSGLKQLPLTKSRQKKVVFFDAAEGKEQTVTACQSGATEVPVDDRAAAGEESDSSSDSDDETMTGDALKSPVKFLRHDSPTRNTGWMKERKQEEPRASKPQSEPGIAVSSGSVRELPTQPSTTAGGQEAQVAHPKAGGQRRHTEAAATPPDTKIAREEGTSGSLQRAGLPLAQSETLREHQIEEELIEDSWASSSANATDTPMEAVVEPIEEVSDPSTYKNTQHHDYTPLTFIDLEMEMVKYRLPQPSSGRLSPRQ
ncbi:uncharacterized protein ndufv3 isoform X1 [Mobula birostris]|uniref:uncharacterized protein ndufv3 isoform X1 n=2 Tax=Mobula birostris TaxID=1983395 RepID=UPI003B28C25B